MPVRKDSASQPAIVVVGSLNMDFVVAVEHLPAPGETVLSNRFEMLPGGKGANQAYAAGRLVRGLTRVRMIGRVGLDVFGDNLKASLSSAGVDVSAVWASRESPTGVALIAVESTGQNSIVVASGANRSLSPSDIEPMRRAFQGASVALFQLESPIETVRGALSVAREEGLITILDPAPAQPLDNDLLSLVDVLTPNEGEALQLSDRPLASLTPEEARSIAAKLRERGPKAVVVKLGEQGCFLDDGRVQLHVPGVRVIAVDTTAAGDTFNAALAVGLAESRGWDEVLRFANGAAALSVTKIGAQSSAPSRSEVDAFLESTFGINRS